MQQDADCFVLIRFVLAVLFRARVLFVLIPFALMGFVLALFLAGILFVVRLLVTLSQETASNSLRGALT